MNRRPVLRSTLALAVLLVVTKPASSETIRVGPSDDVEAAINALQPGDELVIEGGTYTLDERFSFDIAGTEAAPIVIRGEENARPHFHRPTDDQNIIDIDDAEWVELRNIELSGGSAGIRISGARHLTIEACEIHDTGDVGIRANDTGVSYDSLQVLRNEVHHTNGTGEGMYLGCNNDECRIANSLIEGNYIHHTNQSSVEQGDGIEIKEGSYNNVIRDNVIHDTNYPCILTYSTVGNGAANVIERNVMWACGDHGIQTAADAIIRNNIILSANADGIAMQPHQAGSPSNLMVVHNTVIHPSGDAVTLRGATGTVLIANNALYSQNGSAIYVNGGDPSGVTIDGNVGVGGVSGASGGLTPGDIAADFVEASYSGAPPMDVFPATGGALVASGNSADVTVVDFNGDPRNGVADVGAYAYTPAGNPGWTIAASFKDVMEEANPPEGDDGAEVIDRDVGSDSGSGADASEIESDTAHADVERDTIQTDGATDTGSSSGGSTQSNDDNTVGCGCNVGESIAPAGFVLLISLCLLARRTRSSGDDLDRTSA